MVDFKRRFFGGVLALPALVFTVEKYIAGFATLNGTY
jgi:hypothetical protein